MRQGRKRGDRLKKPKIPRLPLRFRLLLYLVMVLFAVLALSSVVFQCFPYAVEIIFYVLAAVILSVGSFCLVQDIKYGIKEVVKPGIEANPYMSRVVGDYRLRTILSAVPGLAGNVIFAIFNGIIGMISHSAWFGSLAAYYILLSMMRIGAVKQEKRISQINGDKERMEKEIAIYRKNSILFIIMAVVLGGMVILLESSLGGNTYPGFTIYAAAAYAFYKIVISTINMVKVKKRKSPLLTIIRKMGYIDACVSILTLQTAMFASFGSGEEMLIKRMNGGTGAIVCLLVLGTGVQGICCAGKMKRDLQTGGNVDDTYTCGGR